MLIQSADNPLVRRLRRLADSARACRDAGRTLAEGLHLIEAATAAEAKIETLVLRSSAEPHTQQLAERVAREQCLRVVTLAAPLYDSVAPVQHGVGLLAEVHWRPQPSPAQIIGDAVFLDGVQDPGNVGTLLRTAAAAGVNTVLLGEGCAYAGAPRVMRAGMGAQFAIGVHDDVPVAALRGRFAGIILAADAVDGESLFDIDWSGADTLWLFGGEGRGLSDAALAMADRRVRIPIAPTVESLNVAAAAAVCLFEQRRRSLSKSAAPAGFPG